MRKLTLICVLTILFGSFLTVSASCDRADDILAVCDTAIAAVQSGSGYDSTVAETELGNLLADAVREESGSDAAIICGGHTLRSITYGDITAEKVLRSVDSQSRTATVEASPAALWGLLETALSHVVLDENEAIDASTSSWYYYPQVSGLELKYDASAPAGNRLLSLSCGGVELDRSDSRASITLALSAEYLLWKEAEPLLKKEDAEATEAEMLLARMGKTGTVTAPASDRTKVVGVTKSWFSEYRLYRFLPYIILIILLIVLPRQKYRLRNMDGSLSKRYKKYKL